MPRLIPRLIWSLVLAALVLLMMGVPAQATFAGANGKIAFTSERDGNAEIYTMNQNGGSQTRLTVLASPACNDGLDNDGDGKIDYPADPGCMNFVDASEVDPPPVACNDGLDNDGDGNIDYPADPGCMYPTDESEVDPPPVACNDGLDNDGDGKIDYPADPGCLYPYDASEVDVAGYPRPKGASPLRVPLVVAYEACTAPNRSHGPPLASQSCSPPVQASTALTVGTPDANGPAANSQGSIRLSVIVGYPGPPDDSDLRLQGSITDVRCRPGTTTCGSANAIDGADYTGEVQGMFTMRITDGFNAVAGGGGTDPATVVDIPYPIAFNCAASASTAEGASCTSNTSANAGIPGAIKDGKRKVIEVGQVKVNDGGPDGLFTTAPNTVFAVQGLFVP